MGIMELGAIGELVGGIAVIASLIFVGFQVRQGNATDQLSASLGLQHSHNEMVRFMVEDAEVLHTGLHEFNTLPEPLRLELASKLYYLYSHSELVFQQEQRGLIDAETAARHYGWLFWVHSWPGPREWWDVGPVIRERSLAANRKIFSPDFVAFVERGGFLDDAAPSLSS